MWITLLTVAIPKSPFPRDAVHMFSLLFFMEIKEKLSIYFVTKMAYAELWIISKHFT